MINFYITKKKLLRSILIASIYCTTAACSNPKSDAQKVCDCFKTVDWQAPMVDANYKKFMAMNGEMLIKYAKEPTKSLEYETELENCTKAYMAERQSKKQ